MTVLLPSSVSLTVSPADPVIDVVVRRKTVEAEGINSYELQSKNGSKRLVQGQRDSVTA